MPYVQKKLQFDKGFPSMKNVDENMTMCLLALFEASTNLAKTTSGSKRKSKTLQKEEENPQSQSSVLLRKKQLTSSLLYNLNKKFLRVFLDDPCNTFLIRYFYNKKGLERTDPFGLKPSCRAKEL